MPALTFGPDLTLLGVLRNLHDAGIPALVASKERGFTTWSRRFWRVPGSPCRFDSPEHLAEDLGRLDIERAVLFPCRDSAVASVSGLDAETARRFPASISTQDVHSVFLDKALFYREAERLGVPIPRTTRIGSVAELQGVPEAWMDAAFLKPTNSEWFHREYGAKAFFCQNRSHAVELCRTFLEAGYALLLQEYVPGPATAHLFIDGFVDRDQRIRACFARRRLRMNPPDFGNSSYMVSIPLDEVRDAVESLERLLLGLRYRGICSAEFKRDERTGIYKVLEVNARPWIFIRFAQQCGVDVCRLAYQDALGMEVDEISSYVVGKTCVYPIMDYAPARKLWREKQLTLRKWAACWLTASTPIFEWSDPGPAIYEFLRLLPGATRRLFRGPKEKVGTVRKATEATGQAGVDR